MIEFHRPERRILPDRRVKPDRRIAERRQQEDGGLELRAVPFEHEIDVSQMAIDGEAAES